MAQDIGPSFERELPLANKRLPMVWRGRCARV